MEIIVDAMTYYQFKEIQYWLEKNKDKTPEQKAYYQELNKKLKLYESSRSA